MGNIFVEAVNVDATAHFNFSEYMPFAGATVTRDIVLLAVDARPASVQVKYGTLSGHVLRADGATPAPACRSSPTTRTAASRASTARARAAVTPPECAVGVATSAADGVVQRWPDLPAGDYRLYAFDQPSLAQGEVALRACRRAPARPRFSCPAASAPCRASSSTAPARGCPARASAAA